MLNNESEETIKKYTDQFLAESERSAEVFRNGGKFNAAVRKFQNGDNVPNRPDLTADAKAGKGLDALRSNSIDVKPISQEKPILNVQTEQPVADDTPSNESFSTPSLVNEAAKRHGVKS